MNESVKKFIVENEYYIFSYFKENSPFFPSCCTDIALMLKFFIKKYFDEDFEIIEAKKKYFSNNKKFHMWMQKGDEIIDFSLFQFYIGRNKFKKIPNDEAYNYAIYEIQRGVFFYTDYYNNMFKEQANCDIEWYLKQYRVSPHSIEIDKTIPPKQALIKYFEEFKQYLV